MKKNFLNRALALSISMAATTVLFAGDLTNTSYYDCGYDSTNPSKCVLYMPSAKLLATHTAGSLDDYAQATGVEATFDNGTLTLPEVTGLSDSDNAALSNRVDSVDFYYIQQDAKGAAGSPMFYLYSPSMGYLAEHEAGKMGAENVTTLSDTKLADGSFSFDVATGVATETEATVTDPAIAPPEGSDIPMFPMN